jgi:hypothetical protein
MQSDTFTRNQSCGEELFGYRSIKYEDMDEKFLVKYMGNE